MPFIISFHRFIGAVVRAVPSSGLSSHLPMLRATHLGLHCTNAHGHETAVTLISTMTRTHLVGSLATRVTAECYMAWG